MRKPQTTKSTVRGHSFFANTSYDIAGNPVKPTRNVLNEMGYEIRRDVNGARIVVRKE